MRMTFRAAAAALALAALPAAVQAQQAPKFAYVEVATVMDQIPGRQQAQQEFEREATGFRAEMQRMQDSLQLLVGNYQKSASTLTAAQRTSREGDLQRKQQEFAQRAQQIEQRVEQRQQELGGRFESLVREAINDVRTTGGYTMIFASGPNSAMLAADKSLDVTDQVLSRMRTIAAGRGTAPATTGAATPASAPATAAPAATAGAPVAAPAGAARPANRPPSN